MAAEVLTSGEKGGASAKMVFIGFGIAVAYTFLMRACRLWSDTPAEKIYGHAANGATTGLPGSNCQRSFARIVGSWLYTRPCALLV